MTENKLFDIYVINLDKVGKVFVRFVKNGSHLYLVRVRSFFSAIPVYYSIVVLVASINLARRAFGKKAFPNDNAQTTTNWLWKCCRANCMARRVSWADGAPPFGRRARAAQ
jgi:hypothetical protein